MDQIIEAEDQLRGILEISGYDILFLAIDIFQELPGKRFDILLGDHSLRLQGAAGKILYRLAVKLFHIEAGFQIPDKDLGSFEQIAPRSHQDAFFIIFQCL